MFFAGRPYENEVVFFHRPSRTLIMCDLAFNFGPRTAAPTRLLMRLLRSYGHFGPSTLDPLVDSRSRRGAAEPGADPRLGLRSGHRRPRRHPAQRRPRRAAPRLRLAARRLTRRHAMRVGVAWRSAGLQTRRRAERAGARSDSPTRLASSYHVDSADVDHASDRRGPRRRRHRAPARFAHRAGLETRAPPEALPLPALLYCSIMRISAPSDGQLGMRSRRSTIDWSSLPAREADLDEARRASRP